MRAALTIQGDDYPATQLLSGSPTGFDFQYTPRALMKAMADVPEDKAFQISEFSLSYTSQMIDQG